MNQEPTNSPGQIEKEEKARSLHPRRTMKGALIAGGALAVVVGLIDPSAKTFTFLGAALFALASAILLGTLARKSKFLSLRVSPQIVLLSVTICLCVAAAEIGLRFFLFQSFVEVQREQGLGQDLGYQYDETLGWFPVPNSRRIYTGVRTVSVAHNSAGFRDPEPVFDSKPRIVFLGDSFTWGYDVEQADRFTEKLRAKHPEWQIYNFGVCGYSTDQEYLLLQRRFEEYKPNVVFLIFCTENDDGGNCSNRGGIIYFKPYYADSPEGLKLKGVPVSRSEKVFCLFHPLLSKFYIVRLIVRAYCNVTNRVPKFSHCPTTAIMGALQKYVADKGAIFAVGLTDEHAELERFLGDAKIPYINLKTDLRFSSGDHWNAEGHKFVCRKIEEFLLSGEYLKRKEPAKGGP